MQAVVIEKPGGPEVLKLKEVPMPEPGPGEIRVRVRATAVNRVDLLQRLGRYPAPPDAPQDVPGVEYAGDVDGCGKGTSRFSCGARVFGLAGGGTYGEYIVVHERTAMRIPDNMDYCVAAAVPEAFITAYDAIVTQAKLSSGETLLIHAVGSGVGTAAVQLARMLRVRSIGTTRTAEKLKPAMELGLDHGIVAADGKFAGEVRRLTGDDGVDVVLELVGGRYVTEDISCMARRGRMVLVGLVGGVTADVDLALVLRNRLEIRGTTLRARPIEEKIQVARLFEKHVVPSFANGALVPVIDRVMPLSKAAEAHAYVAANENFGKVVLEVP